MESVKYIKITGNLLDVLGENARYFHNIGIDIKPEHQMIVDGTTLSYGIILDEELFNSYSTTFDMDKITTFDTIEDVNNDIVKSYIPKFTLYDINALKLDIELSGGIDTIQGYNSLKSLNSQENLRALLQNGDMAGIAVNKMAKLFE